MTVAEAARFLFVSRPHILKLLSSGALLECLPRNPSGQPDIDATSVQQYKAKTDASFRAWLDSQTEDNDPLGL
ncbi:MerR family transcriptional regulator [Paraburkholderia bannensis]|uniref:hypothetical protein n=1 Tax=Paraburkholderia bannensis TaxID=765414 RepID=UPI002AB5E826|nr:hypothetical protein [Paraburkholderia bannensis]